MPTDKDKDKEDKEAKKEKNKDKTKKLKHLESTTIDAIGYVAQGKFVTAFEIATVRKNKLRTA